MKKTNNSDLFIPLIAMQIRAY